MTGDGYSYNDADLLFTVLAKLERRTRITLQEYPSEWVVCKKKTATLSAGSTSVFAFRFRIAPQRFVVLLQGNELIGIKSDLSSDGMPICFCVICDPLFSAF